MAGLYEDDEKRLKVAFLHPDLGIGGAERLIVDAALALKSVDYSVTIYTSHCDSSHCFEEVKRGELKVIVYGDFLPTNILGRFKIVCAFLRQLYLTIVMILTCKLYDYDILILDQLSYCIPLLNLFAWDAKILFYCHFPDQLLASHTSPLRSAYRYLFDKIEEVSTSYANKVVVNSNFTKSVVQKTFKLLRNSTLDVVYPCVSTDESSFLPSEESTAQLKSILRDSSYFLSVNRFERKKNIELAIKSFAEYILKTSDDHQSIVVAGGYDPLICENVEYLKELTSLCDKLELSYEIIDGKSLTKYEVTEKVKKVIFLTSISTDFKNALIANCDLLMYTPTNEHFGIVPLEAMRMGKLVLADKTGGPLETIINFFDHNETYTGFTVESDIDKWEDVLEWVKSLSEDDLTEVAERSKKRVDELFSSSALKNKLVEVIDCMLKEKQPVMHVFITHVAVPVTSVLMFYFLSKYFFP